MSCVPLHLGKATRLMGGKPKYPREKRNNIPNYDDDGSYRGSSSAIYLTTECKHEDRDVTIFTNFDQGVTEYRCSFCRSTWEKVIE